MVFIWPGLVFTSLVRCELNAIKFLRFVEVVLYPDILIKRFLSRCNQMINTFKNVYT